jgi:hypothetical protein
MKVRHRLTQTSHAQSASPTCASFRLILPRGLLQAQARKLPALPRDAVPPARSPASLATGLASSKDDAQLDRHRHAARRPGALAARRPVAKWPP